MGAGQWGLQGHQDPGFHFTEGLGRGGAGPDLGFNRANPAAVLRQDRWKQGH